MSEIIKKTYDYNNQVMDKCYDRVYLKNVDTLKPKVDFLNKLQQTFLRLIGLNNPKIIEPIKNLFDIYNILIDNLEKQAPYLDELIFKAQAPQSMTLQTIEVEQPKEGQQA